MKQGDLVYIPRSTILLTEDFGVHVTSKPIKAIYWEQDSTLSINSIIYYNNSFHYIRTKHIYPIT